MFETVVALGMFTIPLILIFGIFKLIIDLCSVVHEKQHPELKEDSYWKITQQSNCLKNGDFISLLSIIVVLLVLFVFISTGFIGGCLAAVLSYIVINKLCKILD